MRTWEVERLLRRQRANATGGMSAFSDTESDTLK